ncbi:MAG: hypothetical protein LBP72_08415 [Dysgonamonadaceae bacterium]|jgi:hypothetical protein|nr:hypothetical protein [Dysgonamonadaceae bacterium]
MAYEVPFIFYLVGAFNIRLVCCRCEVLQYHGNVAVDDTEISVSNAEEICVFARMFRLPAKI